MYILRLRIYQPQAHYRVPFTYRRRHTYPIPPYSTIIGLLCNLLGIDHPEKEGEINKQQVKLYDELKKLKISIAGRFESKTTEYVWFRNLSHSAHNSRFGSVQNRIIYGEVEHIGGQSPVSIDVLNEVRLIIHLAHENKDFLYFIASELHNPIHRLEVLHIGRAEDWLTIEEISCVKDITTCEIKRRDGAYGYFFWIPENRYLPEDAGMESVSDSSFEGLAYRITAHWTVESTKGYYNRHAARIFDYVKVKLSDGLFVNKQLFLDDQSFPIFLCQF
jgi:CRISPR-associated protein Cas5t